MGSAATILAGSPAAKAAEQLASSAGYRVIVKKTESGRVGKVIVEDGVGNRWELAADSFAGRPTLDVQRTASSDKIVLSGARYAGTSFAFDLTATIVRQGFGNKITFEFNRAGVSKNAKFAMETKLAPWLGRLTPAIVEDVAAQSILETSSLAGPIGLKANGMADIEFRPDNSLSFHGPVSLLTKDGEFAGRRIVLQPQRNDESSLVQTRKRKSTDIRLDKNGTWAKLVALSTKEGWSVDGSPDAFDHLTVQALEGGVGAVKFTGSEGLTASRNGEYQFPLLNHELSETYGTKADTLFAATLTEGSNWIHGPAGSIHLGTTEEDLVIHQTRTGDLSGAPQLQALQVAPNIEGAIISSPPHEPLPVTFEGQSVVVPALFPFDIVRRADMLNLTFFFINFKLTAGATVGTLTRDNTKIWSFIVVIFPPQALAEETVPEDTSDTKGSTALLPPVLTRLSNPTKLVFYIPANLTINATLDGPGGLLDWSQWEQMVAPTAVSSYANRKLVVTPSYTGSFQVDKTVAIPTVGIGVPGLLDDLKKNLSVKAAPAITVLPVNPGNPGATTTAPPARTITPIRTLGNSIQNVIRPQTPVLTTTTPAAPQALVPKFTSFSAYTGLRFTVNPATSDNPSLLVSSIPTGRIAIPWYSPYTTIEIPTWLTISPDENAGWSHSTSGEIVNFGQHLSYGILWHTRLSLKDPSALRDVTEDGKWHYEMDDATEIISGPIPNTSTQHPTIRAIDSFDYDSGSPGWEVLPDYKTPQNVEVLPDLSHITRSNLVDAMTPRSANAAQDTNPFEVERLMLTALGATLKGEWNLKTAKPSSLIDNDLYTEIHGARQQVIDMSLVSWRHIATLGRDHYVKTARRGFLFPTMHRAVLITISERKFQTMGNNQIYALLRTRQFIIVSEPNVLFPSTEQIPLGFQSITCLTKQTPDLDSTSLSASKTWGAGIGQNEFTSPNAIWALVGGAPFGFQMKGLDMDGNDFTWAQPSIFVEWEVGLGLSGSPFSPVDFTTLSKQFNTTDPPGGKAKCPTGGQHISLAPSDPTTKTNATPHPCDAIRVGGVKATPNSSTPIPGFRPILVEADIHIPAVEQLTGNTAASTVQIASVYKSAGGFGSGNTGEVFLELIQPGTGGNAGGGTANSIATKFNDVSKVGGVMSPSMTVGALSRVSGAVGWPPTGSQATPQVPVKQYFQGLNAKILGVVNLSDILPSNITIGGDGKKSPKLTIQPLYNGASTPAGQLPSGVDVNFLWMPTLSSFPSGASQPIFQASRVGKPTQWSVNPNAGSGTNPVQVLLKAEFRTDYGSPPAGEPNPYYLVDGRIADVTVNAIAPVTCIIIAFQRLEFKMEAGKSAQIYVDTDPIQFAGPLSFVQTLESFLGQGGSGLHMPGPGDQPSDETPDPGSEIVRDDLLVSTRPSLRKLQDDGGFGFSPYFNITASGITAGFTLKIPSIAIGILGIMNIGVSGELDLPFLIDPLRVKFSFCTRDDPFALSVWGITGGGFIGITLGLDGLEIFEGSLEFGATIAIDLGVASGSVSLMAGIYFKIESGSTTLTAFVQLNGSVSVLEIITISVTFYLSLTYVNQNGSSSLTGTATISVEVSVLFFSFSVGLTVTKTIGGSGSSSRMFGNDDMYASIGGGYPPPSPSSVPTPIPFTTAVGKTQFEAYWAAFGGN